MAGLSDKWKKIIVRVIAAYVFLGGAFSLLNYFTEAYLAFIRSGDPLSIYLPAALRMTCRIGYPLAGIGLFLLHRWGLWLLVIVWLAQLLPSSIYTLLHSGSLIGHLDSLIEFIVIVGLLFGCRSALKSGKVIKTLLIFLVTVLGLHSALFLTVSRNVDNVTNNTSDRKDPTADDYLVTAVYLGDEQAVKKHLSNPDTVKKELDPACPAQTRCKPITFAAENGNLNILKMLLDAGANPDGATSYGDTALIIAIMNDKKSAIDLLLQYKADVNKTNQFGASAFTGAAGMGDVDLVEKLLQHGADINKTFPFMNPSTKQVQENTTPLSVAVQMGHLKVVELLLKNKADLYIKDSLGKSAVDYSKQGSNTDIKALFESSKKQQQSGSL